MRHRRGRSGATLGPSLAEGVGESGLVGEPGPGRDPAPTEARTLAAGERPAGA